ncbi:MAG: altronate dehydratase family protein [Prevotellaceae bacterium]|jgi:altronate hydrolase|nr:altronate dehydratase family protein [Prevotellaceae bacterium]
MLEYLKINEADNVAVAIVALPAHKAITIDGERIVLREDVPAGHKFALIDLAATAPVVKYGYPIGHTVRPVAKGEWVNERNIKTNLGELQEYSYHPQRPQPAIARQPLTFDGYRRANGDAGVRNEIWIVPTVGCVNGIVNRLAAELQAETGGEKVDAIVAFPHPYGCSQLGDDHENTRKILRKIALHPNAGGVLIVGLGCENNQIAAFRELVGEHAHIRFMETQKTGDEIAEGMRLLRELYDRASAHTREAIPASELKIGLKCGGSDGLSGITANPLVGLFSDFLVAQGGTTVLTEVPEMFGAETILMNRAQNKEVFDKTVHLINDFKAYFIKNEQPVYENPSPGNKAGGISTLEEKSLGCTQKGGKATVMDVLAYGERLRQEKGGTGGLYLLSAPGNDLVASTALAAAGCHVVLFTTGRGTPFGTFVPTMKISTNTSLYRHKPTWIDFNAGTIVEDETPEAACRRFIQYVLRVAGGEPVNNEKNRYREIAIFKTGVTL